MKDHEANNREQIESAMNDTNTRAILEIQNEHKTVIDQMNQDFDNEMSQILENHEAELEKQNAGPREENERLQE